MFELINCRHIHDADWIGRREFASGSLSTRRQLKSRIDPVRNNGGPSGQGARHLGHRIIRISRKEDGPVGAPEGIALAPAKNEKLESDPGEAKAPQFPPVEWQHIAAHRDDRTECRHDRPPGHPQQICSPFFQGSRQRPALPDRAPQKIRLAVRQTALFKPVPILDLLECGDATPDADFLEPVDQRVRRPQNLDKVGDPAAEADIRGIDGQANSPLSRIRRRSEGRTRLLGHILIGRVSRRLTHPSAFSPTFRYKTTAFPLRYWRPPERRQYAIPYRLPPE